jgi:poly-beta-1,6-N-acetyl-D-glucosamine synthase
VATFAIGAWTDVGYPLLIRLAARRCRRPPPELPDDDLPTMTVIIPAHDEEANLPAKLHDLQAQDYPGEKLEVIVADDGSRDRTADVARSRGATVVRRADRVGKRDAINRGLAAATGTLVCLTDTLVCLTDARNRLAPGSRRRLASGFDDEWVAVVSGSNRIGGNGVHGEGEGLYGASSRV